MELLLNLAWIVMALAAFCLFLRNRRVSSQLPRVQYGKALLALACVLVLLFPVISASDDLHPTQAVLEDATKRMQQAVAPLHHVQVSPTAVMLPASLAVLLVFALAGSQFSTPPACEARVIHRERTPRDGRSPPAL
jgi:hypothetical protein